MPNTNPFRFASGVNQDNTYRVATNAQSTLTYASTIAVVPNAYTNTYLLTLTGAATLTISTVTPSLGDQAQFVFAASGANETVTFSTGFAVSASTLVVVSAKFGSIDFTFNGTVWVETGRSLTA